MVGIKYSSFPPLAKLQQRNTSAIDITRKYERDLQYQQSRGAVQQVQHDLFHGIVLRGGHVVMSAVGRNAICAQLFPARFLGSYDVNIEVTFVSRIILHQSWLLLSQYRYKHSSI